MFAGKAIPWYLVLFSFGTIAANLSGAPTTARSTRKRVPWGLVTAACWALCLAFVIVMPNAWFRLRPVSDVLVGSATATLLAYLTGQATADGKSRGVLLRSLESRWLVGLGHFSYSLYLTHLPIVALCAIAVSRLTWSPLARAAALAFVSVPLSVGFAYVFFVVVERPALRWR